jgi:hypothetical protein
VLPADALVYLGGGQLSAASLGLSGHLGSALPKLARTILGQLDVSDTGGLARKLGPVLGKESALAIVPGKTPKTGLPTPPAFVVISKGVAAEESGRALHRLRPRFTGKVRGDRLVLARQPSALKRLSRAKGSLAAAPEFRSATAGLPGSPSLELYLGLNGLVPLFEAAGLAENPAYASFAPEIHRLGAVAAALRPSRRALDATLRITVSGK